MSRVIYGIGVRSASGAWDAALIDIAAVAMNEDGEILSQYHTFIKSDYGDAYKPVALLAAKVNFDWLDEHGKDIEEALRELASYFEVRGRQISAFISGTVDVDARSMADLLTKKGRYFAKHFALPPMVPVSDGPAYLAALGWVTNAQCNEYEFAEWMGAEPLRASDNALERAIYAAKAGLKVAEVISGKRKPSGKPVETAIVPESPKTPAKRSKSAKPVAGGARAS